MKKDFKVTGMTCAACSSRVERVLNKMEGVTKAEVNLATEDLHIDYDDSKLNTQDIIGRIEKAGYGAYEVKEDTKIDEAFKEKIYTFINFCSSIALYINGTHDGSTPT